MFRSYNETMQIRAALPRDIEELEVEMLQCCRSNMPSLPSDNIDVLIIDYMGKDISGVGIDTNTHKEIFPGYNCQRGRNYD